MPLSTFATASELVYLLHASGVSMLVMEGQAATNDLMPPLIVLEPSLASRRTGLLRSTRFPVLREAIVLGEVETAGEVTSRSAFLARGDSVEPGLVAPARLCSSQATSAPSSSRPD